MTTVGEFADKIGAVRALLSGADDETPLIAADGTPSIVTADSNAIAYSRTPQVELSSAFAGWKCDLIIVTLARLSVSIPLHLQLY